MRAAYFSLIDLRVDWQHLFGRFREGQPRLPEFDRRHAARRRMDPEVVVPVHVVRELGPELARRAERLAVDELGLQYPVGRLVDGVVVGAALCRQQPLYAEGLEHQVDLGVVELAAAVRAEDLDVRDGEGERRERRPDQPGVLPGLGGVADGLPVVEVDEQADVVPRGPDAHVGQIAAYMGARRSAAEAARDDVRRVGLVDRPGVHLEPLPAVKLKLNSTGIFTVSARRFPRWLMGIKESCHLNENGCDQGSARTIVRAVLEKPSQT